MLAVRQYFSPNTSSRRFASASFSALKGTILMPPKGEGGRRRHHTNRRNAAGQAGEGSLSVVHLSLSLIGAIASSHPTEGGQRFIHRIQFKKNVCGSQSDFVRRHQTSIRFIKRFG